MKKKFLLVASLAMCMGFAACSDNEDLQADGTNSGSVAGVGEQTFATFTIGITGPEDGTRATEDNTGGHPDEGEGTHPGTYDEQKVYDVDIYFVNTTDGNITQKKHFVEDELRPTNPAPDFTSNITAYTTPAFQITAGTYKVYVIVNPTTAGTSLGDAGSQMAEENTFLYTSENVNLTIASATQGFLMSNQRFDDNTTNGTDNIFTLTNGTENAPNKVAVKVERVVAKFTYADGSQATAQNIPLKERDENNTLTPMKDVTVALQGMDLFNMNKTCYLFKQFIMNDGSRYVTDKNFNVSENWPIDKAPSTDELKTLNDRFFNVPGVLNYLDNEGSVMVPHTVDGGLTDATKSLTTPIYCLENTMLSNLQYKGNSTGVLFKVKYNFQNNNPFEQVLALPVADEAYFGEDGTTNTTYLKQDAESISQALSEVFGSNYGYNGVETVDGAVRLKHPETTVNGTFFTYNGKIFSSVAEAAYYFVANNDDNQVFAAPTADAVKKLAQTLNEVAASKGKCTNWNSGVSYTGTWSATNRVKVYYQGLGYHTAIISNIPNLRGDGQLNPMEYAIVRNHWYQMDVTAVNGFGSTTPELRPQDPDEDLNANVEVQILVMPWKVVRQSVEI
ncbi:MAG: Mfa1 family fimbria major subunit [Clostridium sp.]|nr:Mfa1 family fimbria major subunit [Clostridium sp.]